MNQEERYKITSNNFADLIVDGLALQEILSIYSDVSINIINSQYAVVHIPVENMTPNIIYELGFEMIPKCYGLMSSTNYKSLEVLPTPTIPNGELTGQKVLVGFVDTGIDYMNPAFQYEDHTTRIVSMWDQTIESDNYPESFFFGTEFSKEQLNSALVDEKPLSIVPSMDEIGHGTMLAGIAGGTYNAENGFTGVAPGIEFVVVKLKTAKTYLKEFFYLPQETICYQENDIMLGINYLVQVARKLRRPITICIGLGTSQGAHLSEGIFNNYLSTMGRLGDVAIVVAAGNEGNRGHHYFGEIDPYIGFSDVSLNIGNNESGFFMEFWGNSPNSFTFDLFSPTGEFVGRIPTVYEQQSTMQFKYENTIILADNTLEYSNAGDQFILFRFENPISGIWRFRISGLGNLLSSYHIWLPIINFIIPDTYFLNANNNTTITIPGNEETILTVTSYYTMNDELYYYASNGFTKDNTFKPDIAAPGVNVLAPTTGNQYMWSTGTSVAAAHAAGAVALLQEWGIIRQNLTPLPSAMVRSILTGGARRFPDILYPNPDWGFGILDVYNSIQLIRKL